MFRLGIFPKIDPFCLDASADLRLVAHAVGLIATHFKVQIITVAVGTASDELIQHHPGSIGGVLTVVPTQTMLPLPLSKGTIAAIQGKEKVHEGRLTTSQHYKDLAEEAITIFGVHASVFIQEGDTLKDERLTIPPNRSQFNVDRVTRFIVHHQQQYWDNNRAKQRTVNYKKGPKKLV